MRRVVSTAPCGDMAFCIFEAPEQSAEYLIDILAPRTIRDYSLPIGFGLIKIILQVHEGNKQEVVDLAEKYLANIFLSIEEEKEEGIARFLAILSNDAPEIGPNEVTDAFSGGVIAKIMTAGTDCDPEDFSPLEPSSIPHIAFTDVPLVN